MADSPRNPSSRRLSRRTRGGRTRRAMKRLAIAAVAITSLACLAPSVATAATPAPDSVTGLLHVAPPCDPDTPGCIEQPRYIFDVVAGRQGEPPQGTVVYETGERAGVFDDNGT